MSIHLSTWLSRRKWILIAIGLPVLVALWWAFRPEKLWINERVNEPAPFAASSDPEPIFTARFEAKAQQTSGRATIYKKPGGGQYLTLSDFTSPSGSDFHLLLARGDDQDLAKGVVKSGVDGVDLGPLKTDQGDQNYDLPAATDLKKYDVVVIYAQGPHAVLGSAKLAPF